MRQRMDQHHTNPVCATCHRIFEPIGLAMENFDAIGTWRTKDEGVADRRRPGVLVDGTKVNGVASLRDVLVRYQDQFVRVVTEKLLTYALGPRRRIPATCRSCGRSCGTRRTTTTGFHRS